MERVEQSFNANSNSEPCSMVADGWLMDPELDEARVEVAKVVLELKRCDAWQDDMTSWWSKPQRVETAHWAMSNAMDLVNQRRSAGSSRLELNYKWTVGGCGRHANLGGCVRSTRQLGFWFYRFCQLFDHVFVH